MILQLTGQNERLADPYKEFYGQPIEQMPLLVSGKDKKGNVIDVPRVPISFADVLERRINAPEDVRRAWQNNYVFTGDGSTAGIEGDHLIVLDAQALREMTPESELHTGALVLPVDVWQELKSQKEKVVYLTAHEVKEANGKGYVKKDGIWAPENRSVGKVLNALGRGKDLNSLCSTYERCFPRSNSMLNVYFNKITKNDKPTMQSCCVGSDVYGNGNLDDGSGRLVGVAPEAHLTREKVLEARVHSAIEKGLSFERKDGLLYVPVDRTAATQLRR